MYKNSNTPRVSETGVQFKVFIPSTVNMGFPDNFDVAICGAGLAGLSLALALHSHGIKCTVYEAADTPEKGIRGSFQLAPNGQTPLDRYGILDDLLKSSRIFPEGGTLKKSDGTVIQELILGDKELFGYDSIRIMRRTIICKFVDTLQEKGVPVICNRKFTRIISETDSEVTIEFVDGSTARTSLLVGSDGIHSRLRKSLFPEVEAQYFGSIAIGGSFAASKVDMLGSFPYGLYNGPLGNIMIGPHVRDDTEWVAFLGRSFPDLGRQGWKDMANNKEKLREVLAEGQEVWLPQIRQAIASIDDDELFLWAMYVLPELESWTSPKSKIVLVGDAAHAFPPTAGQGANMAFEDGYTLGLVLAAVGDKILLEEALQFWQEMRKDRLKRVLDLTIQWAKMREPPHSKSALAEYKSFTAADTHNDRLEEMRWIYGGVEVQEQQIKDWVAEHQNSK